MSFQVEDLVEAHSSMQGDFLAEIMAAEMIKGGFSPERLYFRALGTFRRPVGRDVESLELFTPHENASPFVHIEVNREGLYDMLPESIFHFREKKDPRNEKTAILESIKKVREEEADARKFFGPFENEFYHLRLLVELKKRMLLQAGADHDNRVFFESVYGNSALLDDQQVLALLYILPLVHRVRGDLKNMALCIKTLIRQQVYIHLKKYNNENHYSGNIPGLGTALLGVDSVTGPEFVSGDSFYEIHISELPGAEVKHFLEDGFYYAILSYLCKYLFPAGAEYNFVLHIRKEDRYPVLSGDEKESYLGFNTYL